MLPFDPRPLADALAPWTSFYAVLGESAATMVALLFVAASVGSRTFQGSRASALRMFLSASVVHFTGILVVSLITIAPLHAWPVCGALVIAAGLFGLVYHVFAWRDAINDGLAKRIDREDTVWYCVLPILGYLLELAAGVLLALQRAAALPALAVSTGFLMIVAIHNAWDITVWSISRPPRD
jgi:hypothetical protein